MSNLLLVQPDSSVVERVFTSESNWFRQKILCADSVSFVLSAKNAPVCLLVFPHCLHHPPTSFPHNESTSY